MPWTMHSLSAAASLTAHSAVGVAAKAVKRKAPSRNKTSPELPLIHSWSYSSTLLSLVITTCITWCTVARSNCESELVSTLKYYRLMKVRKAFSTGKASVVVNLVATSGWKGGKVKFVSHFYFWNDDWIIIQQAVRPSKYNWFAKQFLRRWFN